MIAGAPRIKEHSDHPAGRGLHGLLCVVSRAAQLLQGDARLFHREGQVRVVEACHLCAQCRGQDRSTQWPAADQNQPHAWWAVAHDRADHLPRCRRPVQPVQIVENKHDVGVGGCVDEQPRRLGMRDAGSERAGGYSAHRRHLLREGLFQIGHKPPRCGVGGVDGQPGNRSIELAASIRHRRRLARPSSCRDHNDPVGIDELAEQRIKPLPRHRAHRSIRDHQLAPNDAGSLNRRCRHAHS